jgi:hypothetical protein
MAYSNLLQTANLIQSTNLRLTTNKIQVASAIMPPFAPTYILPGLGAVNTNVQTATNTPMTLDINVGDCVIAFSLNSGSGSGFSDNGGNAYTALEVQSPNGNLVTCYICLSATAAATSLSSAHTLVQMACTLRNVGSVGVKTYSYPDVESTSQTAPTVVTTGNNSLVFGFFGCPNTGNSNITFSPVTGTINQQGINGNYFGAMLDFQAGAIGSSVTLATTSNGSCNPAYIVVELIPT